ncbi:hypothetical protein QWZ13_18920 [Reinekea marina]|nr:hypothetical protein [Reinekea marina]MDN3650986.1 hypothetical protein [Reinekea marina]
MKGNFELKIPMTVRLSSVLTILLDIDPRRQLEYPFTLPATV